jgi:hypothetical protein
VSASGGREFAHLHPAPDYSLHAMLPTETATDAVEAGWAEPHPVALRGLIPDDIQPMLQRVRQAIRAALPDAEERIRYGMPAP